jgi:hypothetical protein
LRKKILEKKDPSLTDVVDMCRVAEASKNQAKTMERSEVAKISTYKSSKSAKAPHSTTWNKKTKKHGEKSSSEAFNCKKCLSMHKRRNAQPTTSPAGHAKFQAMYPIRLVARVQHHRCLVQAI